MAAEKKKHVHFDNQSGLDQFGDIVTQLYTALPAADRRQLSYYSFKYLVEILPRPSTHKWWANFYCEKRMRIPHEAISRLAAYYDTANNQRHLIEFGDIVTQLYAALPVADRHKISCDHFKECLVILPRPSTDEWWAEFYSEKRVKIPHEAIGRLVAYYDIQANAPTGERAERASTASTPSSHGSNIDTSGIVWITVDQSSSGALSRKGPGKVPSQAIDFLSTGENRTSVGKIDDQVGSSKENNERVGDSIQGATSVVNEDIARGHMTPQSQQLNENSTANLSPQPPRSMNDRTDGEASVDRDTTQLASQLK